MKKLILALSFLALSLPAAAQETLWASGRTINASTQAKIDALRILHNRRTCAFAGLDGACTQAELDAAGKGGRMYGATTVGRQNFYWEQIALPGLDQPLSEAEGIAVAFYSLPVATRNAMCTNLGKPSGCYPFGN